MLIHSRRRVLARGLKAAILVLALYTLCIVLQQVYLLADFAAAFIPAAAEDVLPSFDRHECPSIIKPSAVPRVVHQLWKTRHLDTYSKRPSYVEWKKRYPNWQIVLWDDASLEALIAADYPWLLGYWWGLGSGIQRADVGRLIVLHRHGGVYADLDAPPSARTVDRLDTLCGGTLLGHATVLVRSSDGHIVTNHFMAAAPGAPFIAYALSRLTAQSQALWLPYMRVFYTTGPIFVTRILKEYVRMLRSNAYLESIADCGSDTSIGVWADPIPDNFKHHHDPADVLVIDAANAWHLVEHEGGRSWIEADGRLLNWIADNGLVIPAAIVLLACLGGMATWLAIVMRRRVQYRRLPKCTV